MQYKVLVHGSTIVDPNRLDQGIYSDSLPKLNSLKITKEDLQDFFQSYADSNLEAKENDRFMSAVIDNLSKCEWKLFKLEPIEVS